MAYSEKVLDHYENPRNVGKFADSEENVGTGMVGAPACGDVMRLQIKVSPNGIIEDARFKTFGCGSAIASSSLLTEWVRGKSLDEAGEISNRQIAEELSLPPVKIHCSVLAEDAIKSAIKDYKQKYGELDLNRKKESKLFKDQQSNDHKIALKKHKEEIKHFGKLDRKDKRAEFEENLTEQEMFENTKFIDSSCLRDSLIIQRFVS